MKIVKAENSVRSGNNLIRTGSQIVSGEKDLSHALNISRGNKTDAADRKKFQRMSKQYTFPIHHSGTRIYMFREDIDVINNRYLLRGPVIAKYLPALCYISARLPH